MQSFILGTLVATSMVVSLFCQLGQALEPLSLGGHNLDEVRLRWRRWCLLTVVSASASRLWCGCYFDVVLHVVVTFVISFFHLSHRDLRGSGSQGCASATPRRWYTC